MHRSFADRFSLLCWGIAFAWLSRWWMTRRWLLLLRLRLRRRRVKLKSVHWTGRSPVRPQRQHSALLHPGRCLAGASILLALVFLSRRVWDAVFAAAVAAPWNVRVGWGLRSRKKWILFWIGHLLDRGLLLALAALRFHCHSHCHSHCYSGRASCSRLCLSLVAPVHCPWGVGGGEW